MAESILKPIQRTDGYLPIEDYGFVGDGATAAVIGRDGKSIGLRKSWARIPSFQYDWRQCRANEHF